MGRKVVEDSRHGLVDDEEGSNGDTTEEEFCHDCGRAMDHDSAFCPKCGAARASRSRCSGACACKVTLGVCGCLALAVCILTVCIALYLNSWVKFGVETVGGALLGVPVHVDRVNVGLVQGRATISDLRVASPEGFDKDLFDLNRFVFDIGPMSLLWGWLSDFTKPIELEDLTITDCGVNIELAIGSGSNAQHIVDHMNDVTNRISPQLNQEIMHPDMPDTDTVVHQGVKAMQAKVRVYNVVLRNISVSVTMHPLSAVKYILGEIEIKDIGKKGDGVYLYEFIEVLTRALLMAVLKGAPASIQATLAEAFGTNLWRNLDYAWVKFDNGHGLEDLGQFAGWVAAESATLPLKMALTGTQLTAKALTLGTEINTEALKVGTALTGKAISAQAAATKAELELGAKAAATAARLSLAFTNGFAKALR